MAVGASGSTRLVKGNAEGKEAESSTETATIPSLHAMDITVPESPTRPRPARPCLVASGGNKQNAVKIFTIRTEEK